LPLARVVPGRRPVTEYMAGSTLPQLTKPHQQNANWRSIPGLRANVGCPLCYTKLLFATTAAGGRDGWQADFRRHAR
jgi:hypothetical protein